MNPAAYRFFNARLILTLVLLLATTLSLTACLNIRGTVAPSSETTPAPTSETTLLTETSAIPTPEPTPEPTVLAPSAEAPVIALTFDDGPSLRDTGNLLDLLAEENVPATFLVLGSQVEIGRDALVKRAFDEGHEIGNHGYSHTILTGLEPDEIRDELEKTSSIIEGITGSRPTIMRPPTGAWNDDVASISAELGMAIINWSWQSCPEDWNHRDDPDYIAEHVINNAENGHIILLHDTNEATMAAMPQMIAGLKEKGFRFMTISQMLSFLGDGHPEPGKAYHYMSIP